MKGDFSKWTGRRARRNHFTGVLKQQGRVHLEADWNEQNSITDFQSHTRTVDVIGTCGAPVHNSGFKIYEDPAGGGLLISSGRFYAGGLLCETYPSFRKPVTFTMNADEVVVPAPWIDGVTFEQNQHVLIQTDELPDGMVFVIQAVNPQTNVLTLTTGRDSRLGTSNPKLSLLTPYLSQKDYRGAPALPQAGTFIMYLDVWERHITAIEDPDIKEKALGIPDTDTRKQVISQVRALHLNAAAHCEDTPPEWTAITAAPDSRLSSLPPKGTPPAPCTPGEGGDYTGLENRLYRVEIHADANGAYYFKWSRDNGSIVYPIGRFVPDTAGQVFQLRLDNAGLDEYLKLKVDDYVEITNDISDLTYETGGLIAQVKKVEGNVVTIDQDVSSYDVQDSHPKIRKWDAAPKPLKLANLETLEDGIEIEITGTKFRNGDYWVFWARAEEGKIEELANELPHGVRHHFCKLATVTVSAAGALEIEDCRLEFSPLTEVDGGCCTVTVGKGKKFKNIQQAINSLRGQPGTVCIDPGIYIIDEPILIQGLAQITIKGCGAAPIIVNRSQGIPAMVFAIDDSRSIRIQGLYCVSLNDSRTVVLENTSDITISDCLLVGESLQASQGVVTVMESSAELKLINNVIVGVTGVLFNASANIRAIHSGFQIADNIIASGLKCIEFKVGAKALYSTISRNSLTGFLTSCFHERAFPEKLFTRFAPALLPAHVLPRLTALRLGGQLHYALSGIASPVRHLYAWFKNEFASEVQQQVAMPQVPQAIARGSIIALYTAQEIVIEDNIVVGQNGIEVHGVLGRSRIESNIILATTVGIQLYSSYDICVRSNKIRSDVGLDISGPITALVHILENNIETDAEGILFRPRERVHLITQLEVCSNFIEALYGITISGQLLINDFQISSNTIVTRDLGICIDVNLPGRSALGQRSVTDNDIIAQAYGIEVSLPEVTISGNKILTMESQQKARPAYGIRILTSACRVVGNTISSWDDQLRQGLAGPGGIYINSSNKVPQADAFLIIQDNRIVGGKGNGIEIASPLVNFQCLDNTISDMGLNGIATVEKGVTLTRCKISRNTITNCHQRVIDNHGGGRLWWEYGSIVFRLAVEIEICDNRILDDRGAKSVFIPSVTTYCLKKALIRGNQLVSKGTQESGGNALAVIRIVSHIFLPSNSITISDNIIESLNFRSICLTSRQVTRPPQNSAEELNENTIIVSNRFISVGGGGAYVQSNRLVLSNNIGSAVKGATYVDLVRSRHVVASGNIVTILPSPWPANEIVHNI